jgi:hypothetical protein
MNKLTPTIIATLALASSAFGAIGETPEQFETGKPVNVHKYQQGTVSMTWAGPRVVHMGLFGPVSEGQRCVMEKFWFRDGHALSTAEIGKFLAPYLHLVSTYETLNDGTTTYTFWKADDGTVFTVVMYDMDKHTLSVMTTLVWEQVYKADALAKVAEYNKREEQSAASAPAPAVESEQQDCLIIATEALARLSKSAYWARIAGFRINKNSDVVGSHAVVFFQPTASSNVFMYDKTGSLDLGTQSHDSTELTAAVNRLLSRDYRVEDTKWVGNYAGK